MWCHADIERYGCALSSQRRVSAGIAHRDLASVCCHLDEVNPRRNLRVPWMESSHQLFGATSAELVRNARSADLRREKGYGRRTHCSVLLVIIQTEHTAVALPGALLCP